MESSEPTTINKIASLDSDPRLALVRQRHAALRYGIDSINNTFQSRNSARLSHVFQFIESTFFYETSAHFGLNTRLTRFFSSLRIGDRFVAKVTSVFGRSADVRIIWSTKRDVRDLKIKAVLRMIESKRYSNGYRSSESYRRQNSNVQQYKNLDVSEQLFVELVSFSEANRKMEVVRCSSLVKDEVRLVEENQEEEDTMLNEDKYQAISSNESFHDYMINHRDLHNPSLIKHQICSSLLHSEQVLESYKEKLSESNKKSNNDTSVQEDDDVVILDERKVNLSTEYTGRRSETQSQVKDSSKCISNNGDSLKSADLECHKRTSVTSEPTTHTSIGRRRPRSSSSSSASSCSESSSTSDDSQRKRRKHSHKKRKSHHKGRSKHSKKSKKKKSRKHRKRDSSDRKSPGPKKIDNKILELLNMTK